MKLKCGDHLITKSITVFTGKWLYETAYDGDVHAKLIYGPQKNAVRPNRDDEFIEFSSRHVI